MSTIQLDFQTAPALRDRVRGRRQRPPPPDHDPPGPVRHGGAVLRHPARALRRRPPDLAVPRAGAGPRRCGTTTRTTPHKVADRLRAVGVRVAVDPADEPLGARIRQAKLQKMPYILVVGDDDVAAGTVGVNRRGIGTSGAGRGARDLHRGSRAGDRRSGARLRDPAPVSLEHLWAGWRSEYVSSVPVPRGGAGGASSPDHPLDDPAPLRVLPHRGQRVRRRPDNGVLWRGRAHFAVLNAYPTPAAT